MTSKDDVSEHGGLTSNATNSREHNNLLPQQPFYLSPLGTDMDRSFRLSYGKEQGHYYDELDCRHQKWLVKLLKQHSHADSQATSGLTVLPSAKRSFIADRATTGFLNRKEHVLWEVVANLTVWHLQRGALEEAAVLRAWLIRLMEHGVESTAPALLAIDAILQEPDLEQMLGLARKLLPQLFRNDWQIAQMKRCVPAYAAWGKEKALASVMHRLFLSDVSRYRTIECATSPRSCFGFNSNPLLRVLVDLQPAVAHHSLCERPAGDSRAACALRSQ